MAKKLSIINHLNETQVEQLYWLYQNEWWTKGRRREDIQQMLKYSDLVIAFCDPESEALLAFSRVLTDYIYKALIFDVIVTPAQRGSGLGKSLLDAVLGHADLQSIQHFELYCAPEMVPFYQKWGFQVDLGALKFMRKRGDYDREK